MIMPANLKRTMPGDVRISQSARAWHSIILPNCTTVIQSSNVVDAEALVTSVSQVHRALCRVTERNAAISSSFAVQSFTDAGGAFALSGASRA